MPDFYISKTQGVLFSLLWSHNANGSLITRTTVTRSPTKTMTATVTQTPTVTATFADPQKPTEAPPAPLLSANYYYDGDGRIAPRSGA